MSLKNIDMSLEEIGQEKLAQELENLKAAAGKSEESELLKDMNAENMEIWKSRLQTLFGRLNGFNFENITILQVKVLINSLKVIKSSFSDGKDFLSRVLVTSEGLQFSQFYKFCEEIQKTQENKSDDIKALVEQGRLALSKVIDEEELKRMIEEINKGNSSGALDMLKEEIRSSYSSAELFAGSKLSQKIDEFLKDGKGEAKNSKEFWENMDGAWFGILSDYVPEWSKNTINAVSVGSSMVFMELLTNLTGDIFKGLPAIKEKMTKIYFLFSTLESIGKKLGFDKNKYESEKYEALNNPYQFSLILKEYFDGKLDNNALEKKITDSKKEGRYSKISPEDKKNVKDLGDKIAPELSSISFGVISMASKGLKEAFSDMEQQEENPQDGGTQSPQQSQTTSKTTPETQQPQQAGIPEDPKQKKEREAREKFEQEMTDAGIDNPKVRNFLLSIKDAKMRAFIFDVVKIFFSIMGMAKGLKGMVEKSPQKDEFIQGMTEFMNDEEGMKNSIFADIKGIMEKTKLTGDAIQILAKHKEKTKYSWKEFLAKFFRKDTKFFRENLNFKTGEIRGLKDKDGKEVKIWENQAENTGGKTVEKNILKLDGVSNMLVYMEQNNLIEQI